MDRQVTDALKSHRDVLTSQYACDERDLDSFNRFCRSRVSTSLEGRFAVPPARASFEELAKTGGTAKVINRLTNACRDKLVTVSELHELADQLPPELFGEYALWTVRTEEAFSARGFGSGSEPRLRFDECAFLFDKRYEVSLEDWELVRERLFSIAAAWLAVDWDNLPKCRQTAIRERGWKSRIVTPEEAAFGYLCSVCNSWLLSLLRHHPEVSSSLRGTPAFEVDWQVNEGRSGSVIRSLDLKAASDYLPHDLLRIAVEGLCDSAGASIPLRRILRRAVGPHRMRLSQEIGGGEVITSRGSLMGNPVTWPLLSLYTWWLHVESLSSRWFAVVGDDYIGAHNFASNARMTRVLVRTGGVPSPGKDITGQQGFGVLAEQLISLGRRRVHPTASIRALAGIVKGDNVPLWSVGPALAKVASECMDVPVGDIVALTFAGLFRHLRRNGVDPCAPRWAGGAGFPGTPTQLSLRFARQILSQKPVDVLRWISQLESAWVVSRALRSSLNLLSAEAQVLLTEFGRRLTPQQIEKIERVSGSLMLEGERVAPLDDLVTAFGSMRAFAFAIAEAPPERRFNSLTSGIRIISSVRTAVADKAWWVGYERVRAPEGLASRLIAMMPWMKIPAFWGFRDVCLRLPPRGRVAFSRA